MEQTEIGKKHDMWQQRFQAVASMLDAANNVSAFDLAVEQLSLLSCMCVQDGKPEHAIECLNILLLKNEAALLYDSKSYVSFFYRLLTLSARKRLDVCFLHQLRLLSDKDALTNFTFKQAEAVGELINAAAFIAADRKIDGAKPYLKKLFRKFTTQESFDEETAYGFLAEWLQTASQIVRRKWRREADFMFRELFYCLLKKKSLKLTGKIILQLNMVMHTYSRWDGFNNCLAEYKRVQDFYLLLLARGMRNVSKDGNVWLKLTLRGGRDFLTGAARGQMMDETGILRIWRDFLLEQAKGKRRRRCEELAQLTILYWSQSKAKKSRRHMCALQELLEPFGVEKKYADLLASLI